MSTRERIVLALCAVAVLYGAYVLFLEDAGGGGGTLSADDLKTLEVQVADLRESFRAQLGGDPGGYVLEAALIEWKGDPFLKQVRPEDDADRPRVDVRFTGYVDVAGRKLAIIDGMEYGEGDVLRSGSHRVKRIEPRQIELVPVNGGEPTRVAIEAEPAP